MRIAVEKDVKRKILYAVLTGVAAGFLNGFLGAGSGVILMFVIGMMNPRRDEAAARDNFATVVACVLPLSLVSVIIYSLRGAADEELVGRFMLPAVIGGVTGAFLTDKLNAKVLRLIFAVIVIIAGINMIL